LGCGAKGWGERERERERLCDNLHSLPENACTVGSQMETACYTSVFSFNLCNGVNTVQLIRTSKWLSYVLTREYNN
jgi:hypothetical protein